MRVTLLGCGGFLGPHLADWLLERPDVEVVGTDIRHEQILHLLDHPRFRFYDSDISHDRELTQRLVQSSDVVVDLVSMSPSEAFLDDPLQVFRLDLVEKLRVAEVCAASQTRLVEISSAEVYGKPWPAVLPSDMLASAAASLDFAVREDESPLIQGPIHRTRWIYAASKQVLERAIHAAGVSQGLDYTIVRPFNPLGPRFEAWPRELGSGAPRIFGEFMEALLRGTRMAVVDGGAECHTFVYVADATECIGRIVMDDMGVTSRQIFNVGNPETEVSIADLAQLMREEYAQRHWDGSSALPEVVSIPHEDIYGDMYDHVVRRVPDISKAQRLLGWQPRWGLRELVTTTMDAYVVHDRADSEREQVIAQ